MSTLVTRQFVFSVQGSLYLLNCILILVLLKDSQKTLSINNKTEYFSFVKGGIKCLLSNRVIFFFIIGYSISTVTWSIWISLLQKPIYFGYTGSDSLASLLRSLILILGIPIGIFTANISKKFDNKAYPYIVLVHNFLFFPSLYILFTMSPMLNTFDLFGFIGVLLIQLSLTSSLFYIGETLRQRVMIELIPSDHRNAIYSLTPTIVALLGFPLIPLTGRLIDMYNLQAGLLISLIINLFGASCVLYSFYAQKDKK